MTVGPMNDGEPMIDGEDATADNTVRLYTISS